MSAWKKRESRLSRASSLPAAEDSCFVSGRRFSDGVISRNKQKSAWVLKAPEAELTDATGKQIVHHFAGPAWKHIDGSEVRGKVVAKQDAPKPDAIPWLLLSAARRRNVGPYYDDPTDPHRGRPATESKCL
jgi:hypothetical protein